MTTRDLIALVISFVYPTVLLAGAQSGIRRGSAGRPEFTRKLVHIGAGMWVFGALALFDHWWAALIATTAFIGINYLSARRSLIPAMDAARSEGLGTVWFMVSFTVLLGWLWPQGRPALAAAAMMALTWGDAAAALVGRAMRAAPLTSSAGRRARWKGRRRWRGDLPERAADAAAARSGALPAGPGAARGRAGRRLRGPARTRRAAQARIT